MSKDFKKRIENAVAGTVLSAEEEKQLQTEKTVEEIQEWEEGALNELSKERNS